LVPSNRTLTLYRGDQPFPILTADESFALPSDWYTTTWEAAGWSSEPARRQDRHEYRNYGLKLADLVQEGNIGPMRAVKKFDPTRLPSHSYAVWWIRAYIQNYIIKSWSLVKIWHDPGGVSFFQAQSGRKRLAPETRLNWGIAERSGSARRIS
jgi:RNA polymerase sigma-32 factor